MLKVGLCVSTTKETAYATGHNTVKYNQYINKKSDDIDMKMSNPRIKIRFLGMKVNQRNIENPHAYHTLLIINIVNYNDHNRNKKNGKINMKMKLQIKCK